MRLFTSHRHSVIRTEGKQVVVHNRRFEDTNLHELLAIICIQTVCEKGVYGMLLTAGEKDEHPGLRTVPPYRSPRRMNKPPPSCTKVRLAAVNRNVRAHNREQTANYWSAKTW